ncbi:3-hydroxyacyl-CoA dehydrogenase NAD-binding domain-containing protein [Nocardioides marmoribigeumensis]|uniref:3-hydroxyacyl-CoA dehydrogenase/enoyl-CoA hydratase/3-hydroxybutyryl-CoA epimerase n=1 Tax=Nocardioides marmoribigeumensis TaxID=433649 RepID=A0ABU2BVR5_9ACTN|nr:3-hydroxyacyl-CoA dehydrogenase NAD-binding domain-containing protein [Nocardioides marmoribigeumensis]MDR7362722.1 3-hydroxyacyl-CoA dehydrogenase/enoyl-CoA hydratase/3-hydroxybutyryl-CoA epimerase [Nocardioides marmoribigeumensis]
MTDTSAVRYERDNDGIVTLTMDDPSASANTMNEAYKDAMKAAVDRLHDEKDDITGVVLTSAKKTFFAGGNLNMLQQATKADAQRMFEESMGIKADLRRLETLGKPVVAAINGAALGGGLEIALATHHRIAAEGRYEIGLPEVTLGLLPGGGGVARTVRMLGLQTALTEVLLQGQRYKPEQAREKGLIDEIVPADQLVDAAKKWIASVKDDETAAQQPWDRKGYKMPGGTPSHPALAQMLPVFPATLRKTLKGADYPAPRAIMSAAVEGAQLDFAGAERVEARYFVELATGQNAKNMIQAFFFDLQAINSGKLRPQGHDQYVAKKVVVLGAGMMGAGIAYVCAKAGMEVVLKDVSLEAAERGKSYSQKINEKAVSRGKLTQEKSDELLGRITPTDDPQAAAGADLVIEAVFEDPSLKAKVFAEILPVINSDALLCSNTSTLPITELADGVDRPDDFIGLHFFSPVDKMPLVEIIRGEKTSDAATAKAIDVVQQIRKTPIVVNDSRGFYTSRVIGTQINEGLAMLGEGVRPMTVERAALQAGYPVGPLQITDELNMELMVKIRNATKAAVERDGGTYTPHPAEKVIDAMIEAGRPSKLKGAGFYEYDESGKRGKLWTGLSELFTPADEQPDIQDCKDRMLFIESIETVRCFDEGVLNSTAEANIGSIFGIGFPANTGGAAQFINGYEGPAGTGTAAFVARARELAAAYGERFEPPASLVEKAEKNEPFTV